MYVRMLANTREFYFAEEYKSIIDHIASNNVSMLEFRSKYGDMPILPDKYENILKMDIMAIFIDDQKSSMLNV